MQIYDTSSESYIFCPMLLLADNPQYLCACAMRFSITVDIYVSMRAVFIPKQKCDFATYAWNGGYYYFGDNNSI